MDKFNFGLFYQQIKQKTAITNVKILTVDRTVTSSLTSDEFPFFDH